MPHKQVNGVSLYYEVHGEGEPLLLLHGLGSSVRDWERQIPVFSRYYQVIGIDMRGHGRSDKPPGPYTVSLFAQDTAALLRALQLPPAHIIGISMGGMIAFQLAVDTPELVRSLVIVNSGPELIPKTWREKLMVWQRLFIIRLLGMRRMGEFLAPRLFPRPDQAEERAELIARWAENDKQAYLAAMRALIGWSVADHLDKITCPVLVLAADGDYTPVSDKEAYVARLPNARLQVIADSRHATPIDQTELFNTAVLQFLAQV
ncbi:MAG: alpha/beta fold hydrolase [Chloroflexi bacterium]|nr:MAG: alpha/beta fold hydrolase [Chloroflexota bacterium]